jgi:inosose dehydratase
MPTRRHFLQWAGAGAAASLAARHGVAVELVLSKTQTAKETPKRRYDLGVASYTFHKLPFDKALALTNRVGLKHICLNPIHMPVESTPEQLAQFVAKVKAAGLDLYASGVVYMNSPADVNRAFEFAKAAGLRLIVGVPLHELLPLVNEKVQQYDIPVAIHNHGPGDKVYPTPNVAYEKIKDLDPRVGLCVDIGYVARSGLDLSQVLEQFAGRLLDFHVKDTSAATASGSTVEVGRGVIDIPQFFRTLDKIGYAGKVSFEFEKDPDDPLPGLAESVGYVRGVFAVI